jgi:lysophospholipid acyltransferase (LPLAT)-like uncharacterized protein
MYMRLVRVTGRLDRPTPPQGGPFILATWHSRLFLLSYLRLGERPLIALISGNRDGQLISKIARMFGIYTVAGSSSRGGPKAIREMIRLSRDGHSIYITPDGPRGPAMRAQRGVVEIARLTGLPILPAAASTSSGGERDTWDRILVPYPFGRTVVRWGEPIRVGKNSNVEAVCARVETALTELQQRADRACGRSPVAPGRPRKLVTSN